MIPNGLTPPPELNIYRPYRRGRRLAPCPCCRQPGGLCADHRARLAVWRAELDVAAKAKGLEGRQKKSPQQPTCSVVGCWEPRRPPLPVCDSCAEEAE